MSLPIRISISTGKVEGDITCASLVQGETSEIIGAVKVRSAKLAGIVRGTIDAGELVILEIRRSSWRRAL